MIHQFQLLALPDDFNEIGRVLSEDAGATYLSTAALDSGTIPVSSLQIQHMGREPLKVLAANRKSLGELKYWVSKSNGRLVDSMRSDVIEISRCYFDGTLLRVGRFFYEDGFFDQDKLWYSKSAEFLVWAQKVFKDAKKMLSYDRVRKVYVGRAAAQWLSDGNHNVAMF